MSDSAAKSEIEVEYLDRSYKGVKWISLSGVRSDALIELSSSVYAHWLSIRIPAGKRIPSGTKIRYRIQSDNEPLQQAINSQVSLLVAERPHWIEFASPFSAAGESSLLIQMSCRSLENKQTDAVLGAKAAIESHRKKNPWGAIRLLLAGDQIYTDEWSSSSIKDVVALAKHLGQEVSVPDGVRRRVVLGTPMDLVGEVRLLTNLEIVSAYLLGLSPRLAERFVSDKKIRMRIVNENKAWMELMATVPTYMMFDDHEVADDWNIDASWSSACEKSAVCRWLMGNAFLGCYIFQIIGNEPDAAAWDMASLAAKECRKDLIGSARESALALMKHSMSFVIPGTKEVAVLDCRTKRVPYRDRMWVADHSKSGREPCLSHEEQKIVLCARTEIESVLTRLEKGELAVLAVGTPVLARPGVERAQRLGGRGVGARILDRESWDNFPQSWVTLADVLMDRTSAKGVVILCGDVHYGFAIDGSICRSDGKSLKVLQITSSPAKNYSTVQSVLPLLDEHGEIISACWEVDKNGFESISAARNDEVISKVIEDAKKHGAKMHLKRCNFDKKIRFFRGTNFAMVELGVHSVKTTLCNSRGEEICSKELKHR
ncbi:hypothetical protein [Pseudoxanthomonas putridarboris]|uniref:hypothetical protein n=1 Tax=Pseudoxanthomonas putridarboris TaxID=752605 RepID=UPI00311F2B87